MNTTHPLKMTPDRYDHPVHGPLNVCILFTLPTPQSPTWVRGPPARLVRCGAGITPTTNEGHSPPLEREVKRLRPIYAPRPTITWVRGPPARLVRCGAGITPTTNEGHSPPLEREVERLRPIYTPHSTITWVRGPPARLVRCGAGITPTTNEGHRPPLEREVERLRPIVRSPLHHHLGARASRPPCAVWGWHYPHHKRRA